MRNSTLPYRPEIDGLRAVAVAVVLLFHAKLGCPGGYVGVDVFFVISGFLITSLILRDIDGGRFQAIEFWERRVRRIAPALIASLAGVLVAGWFLYLPDDFRQLGRAAVAQVLCASNVYHWRVAGYFGPEAEALPLLHTWSLAVEEQFYLCLPMALVFIAAWRRAWVLPVLIVAAIASFTLCVWGTSEHPAAAFYLLPTRAWELLLGSLLAASPTFGSGMSRGARECISAGGLMAIVASVALFDAATPFPGVAALVPCLGSVALIVATGGGPTLVGNALAAWPVVLIGQLSYSLYLIHWPLFVFASYWLTGEMTWQLKIGLLATAFVLAWVSWIVIETPIRRKWALRGRLSLFSATALAMALLALTGQSIYIGRGFPERFDSLTLTYAAARGDRMMLPEVELKSAESGELIRIGDLNAKPAYLLWGDSHARSIVPAIEELCQDRGVSAFLAAHSETPPLCNFTSRGAYSLGDASPAFSEAILEFASKHKLQTVLLAACWSIYESDPQFEPCLRSTVARIRSAGMTPVIIQDVPDHIRDVPKRLALAHLLGGDVRDVSVSLAEHRRRNRVAESLFATLAGPEVVVLDPTPYFLDEGGRCQSQVDGRSLYHDRNHLTTFGARRLKPLFEELF